MNGKVLVAICTKDRPNELRRCIDSVVRQTPDHDWDLLVVDNSSSGTARPTVDSLARLHSNIYWHAVPTGGLASARNAAVSWAEEYEALIFIDDDEEACPGWLNAFVRAMQIWPEDALVGPVVSYVAQAPEWDPHLRYFSRAEREDGTLLETAGNGNVLLPRHLFVESGIRYAPWLDGFYGEDHEMFTQYRTIGGRLRWVANARVVEHILPSRLSVRYPYWRGIRTAQAWTLISKSRGNLDKVVLRAALATQRLLTGLVLIGLGAATHRPAVEARGWGLVGQGRGFFSGLLLSRRRPWEATSPRTTDLATIAPNTYRPSPSWGAK